MVDGSTGHHQTRVEGSSSDSTEWMPSPVIEPIPKVVESMLDEVFRCAEVEPRVDYINISQSSYPGYNKCPGESMVQRRGS